MSITAILMGPPAAGRRRAAWAAAGGRREREPEQAGRGGPGRKIGQTAWISSPSLA